MADGNPPPLPKHENALNRPLFPVTPSLTQPQKVPRHAQELVLVLPMSGQESELSSDDLWARMRRLLGNDFNGREH